MDTGDGPQTESVDNLERTMDLLRTAYSGGDPEVVKLINTLADRIPDVQQMDKKEWVQWEQAAKKALYQFLAEIISNIAKGLTKKENEAFKESSAVWDSPRVKAILAHPEGAPMDISELTPGEIDALAREARGMWEDHPFVKDSVKWVRQIRRGLYRGIPKE
ncbi:MAG: hypothetical protein EXR54_00400 [Dehalococcoidia bacterium]|nr:hypothetical protein [Dehalococcoidia bacterium]MSQ16021.1 hypothetical protein [Dehalococcoidia bacterium]